jgi:hypothetical protein
MRPALEGGDQAMARGRVRASLAALASLIVGLGLNPLPASGASPQSPSVQPARSSAALGILSERRQMLAGLSTHSMPARPAQTAHPLTSCSSNAWRVVDGQNGPWNNLLSGVAAVSPTDIWAVGNSQDASTGNDQNFTQHWDGTAWSAVSVPNFSSGNDLNDVAAITANDVWTVGVTTTSGSPSGTTFHWNGSSWTFVAPAPGGSLNDVTAIASGDLWAVGQSLNPSSINVTQIQQGNGITWSAVGSQNVGTGDNVLYGVGASGHSDVWAVGYSRATPASPRQPLIEHYNGTSWSLNTTLSLANATLIAVAATSTTDAWAVGFFTGSNGGPVGIVVHWNGIVWANVPFSEPSVVNEVVGGISAVSSTDYWAVGFDDNNGAGPLRPFALHYNGATWDVSGQNGVPSMAVSGLGDNRVFSVATPAAGDVWAVGTNRTAQNLDKNVVENYSGLAAPTTVQAIPGDQSAAVSWVAPCDGGSPITSYVVTAYDGCTIQGSKTISGAPPLTTTTFTGLMNGTAYTFGVAAVNGFGLGPASMQSLIAVPTGPTTPTWLTACSPRQYTLTNSDGHTWLDMDANLGLGFTPSVAGYAVLSGNVDLWTANAGYNQDVGITVSGGGVYPSAPGQPEAWKESGGSAGTYSPNAAYVQTVIPVAAATPYTAKLQWKTNKPDQGTVAAGAGPIGTAFSPSRLTVQLIPSTSATVFSKSSTAQYALTGSDGSTWRDMDSTNLSLTFPVPNGAFMAYVSGNADLWTSSSGYNQDIGVWVSGFGFPGHVGQPEAWKESGGFAGTFSPNAAFVVASPGALLNSSSYTVKLQWKANRPDPGTIWAGAGPINGHFSPTTLTVILVAPTSALAVSTVQYTQVNSDGSYWQPVSPSALQWTLGPGMDVNTEISANADLWTAVPGYNQDIGIMVSGGAYGLGTLVAWKESGGFAGTFSPNAALVTTVLQLRAGNTYTVWVVWKANRLATVANTIAAGAGPINANFSPTSLSALHLS